MFHGVVINPASSVRGPKYSVREGKTPAFDDRQVRSLLDSIDTSHVVGIRDKTLLMILAYTAARAGAVAKLRTADYFTDGRSWYFNFGEKGGKLHQVPARHDLQVQMEIYIRAAGLEGRSDKTPLFRTAKKKKRELTDRGLNGQRPAADRQASAQGGGPARRGVLLPLVPGDHGDEPAQTEGVT